MHIRAANARGFTIVEAVVALAIVTTGVLGLANVAAHVTGTVQRARRHTVAAVLADQAIAARLRLPMAPTDPGCLQRDLAACAELLDGGGRPTAAAPVFVRRWRSVPLSGVAPPAFSLTLCVVPAPERAGTAVAPGTCVSRVVWEAQP